MPQPSAYGLVMGGRMSLYTLSQEEFSRLLLPLGRRKAVIVAFADLFDFTVFGAILGKLNRIAGDNPVILAANKCDPPPL